MKIIREIPGEHAELNIDFEEGPELENLYVITLDRGRMGGFHSDELLDVMHGADDLQVGFLEVEEGSYISTYSKGCNFRAVMEDCAIRYSPQKCHALKEWARRADTRKVEDIAEYLTITTGRKWAVTEAHGYCQGDYAQVLCPEDEFRNPKRWGEVWLGAAKEFCVITLDEDGEETETVCGYIVADCEATRDEDYKRIVCLWADCDPAETRLEMVDGCRTYTEYTYRTV